jgi:hypothetical protein
MQLCHVVICDFASFAMLSSAISPCRLKLTMTHESYCDPNASFACTRYSTCLMMKDMSDKLTQQEALDVSATQHNLITTQQSERALIAH